MEFTTDKYSDGQPKFIEWLLEQSERDDIIGDLATDVKKCVEQKSIPISTTFLELVDFISDNFDLSTFRIHTANQTPEKIKKSIETHLGRTLHKGWNATVSPILCMHFAWDEYEELIKRKRFLSKIKKQNQTFGYVYFIGIKNLENHIKIGSASVLGKRQKTIETSSPFDTLLLGFIKTENYKTLEKKIHKEFKHKHIKREWFAISLVEVKTILTENNGELINTSY